MKKLVIFGGSGHAHAAIDAAEQTECFQIAGILDDRLEKGSLVMSYPVLGRIDELGQIMNRHTIDAGHVAIGDNWTRARVVSQVTAQVDAQVKAAAPALEFVSIIHPAATVSRHACLGRGVMVLSGAVVGPQCHVQDFCSIWTGASLDHDGSMDAFSSLAPGVATGGNVSVGAYSAISLSASIVHGVRVGAHTVVGAGATVLNDLPDHVVAYGTPARVIRKRNEGERYL